MNETKFVSTLIRENNGMADWTNENTKDNENNYDSYIDGIYYPVPFFIQGGNSKGLKDKLMNMELDYKELNKIWRAFPNPVSLSKKLSIEELVDTIVLRTLAKANNWKFCKEDGRWTVVKPYN